MQKNTISSSEAKGIQLEVLAAIDRICERLSIRYCLCGGTLLGAIRHQGYIPWDDDIDILMPRCDYNRFLTLAPKELGDAYHVATWRNNSSHIYPFAKVVRVGAVLVQPGLPDSGVGVDVFPMDGLPSSVRESNRHFLVIKVLDSLLWSTIKKKASSPSKAFLRIFLVPLSKVIGRMRILSWIEKKATQYDFEGSQYVAVVVTTAYGRRERVSRAAFTKFIKMPFEGKMYPVPSGFAEYLGNLYPNYMELPPIEKRVSHHKWDAFWIS